MANRAHSEGLGLAASASGHFPQGMPCVWCSWQGASRVGAAREAGEVYPCGRCSGLPCLQSKRLPGQLSLWRGSGHGRAPDPGAWGPCAGWRGPSSEGQRSSGP